MLSYFRRVTSSGKYIPEIDGLRFIAILSVVTFHFNGLYVKKNPHTFSDSANHYDLLNYIIYNGYHGVPLFFAISGFILALPFANYYIAGGKKVGFKGYLMRRVTRLEPPYIISLLLLFAATLFVTKTYTLSTLLPSLLASLTYTHNFIYGRNVLPLVSIVAWSLEIEVQFYLLAPFLCKIFKLPSASRRTILIAGCLLFPILHNLIVLPFTSLFDYLHYFLIGFILADLYVSKVKIALPNAVSLLVGILCFCSFWLINTRLAWPFWQIVTEQILSACILCFYCLVLFTEKWKALLSINLFTIVGGMCYSIYLLHFPIISMVSRVTLKYQFTRFYLVDWLIQFILISGSVLLMGALFFAFVEKPCMSRDWPQKLWVRVRRLLLLKKRSSEVMRTQEVS